MIKSMTAYARAEIQTGPTSVRIEVRSFNNRHLDVALKLTHGFESLEERIRGVIAESVARGRVDIRVQIQEESETGIDFAVNLPRAQAYHRALGQLKEELGIEGAIGLETVLAGGSMVQSLEMEKDSETIWPQVQDCLKSALEQLDAMRKVEGDNMAVDFKQRLDAIERMLHDIESQAAGLPDIYRQRLKDRIDALTHGMVEIDEARIAQEAALLADRSDISEEIVRAKSHIQQFRARMEDDTPAGRPLNFLLQEFNREFNTMGSKSGKADMSHVIVAVKSELEKLREQVQNVE
ncbi:YicC/YloC family endoribonuclease [uncultured Desulfosarcina sp.]|uniref:YicC/YloC family endoribonuclease n=1 Tax=uncultured Desulfosarcina sp. TaxID=218289 RepID=UPI0029C99C07|nr:YicC/YloC family endoribonuclease [uncultured Desulfosarcina sp.]